jgi:ADP-heptose:LPS heptosyltransferase
LFVKKNFYKKNQDKIDLIIDLQSKFRNTLILKKIPHINFYSTTFGNFFSSKKIKYKTKNHIENLSLFLDEKIKLTNFNHNKLPKNLINEAKKLLPKSNYIGFSVTQGNEYRKKSWSIYKFISLANKSLIKNKIPVFFIEKNQEHIIEKIKNQVPGSLFPEINSELSCPALVTALSSRLDQAVSIDNGVMHMMALADIPMIVLFGPTNSEKFAPKNNYTKILDSKKLHGTKDIESISVDEVYGLI